MAKYEKWLEQEGLLLIEGWARDGLTDEQIASNMGVSRSTLNSWKDKYPDILDALKKGKEIVDRQVENALLKRALGYEYEEVKEEYEFGELSKKVVIKKSVLPDTTAQIFWLKNRKSKDWRGKQERLDNTAEDNDMVKQFVEGMKQHGKTK